MSLFTDGNKQGGGAMRAYVGYSTSVLYWLKNGMDEFDRVNIVHTKSLNDAAYTLRDLEAMQLDLHGLESSTARGWPDRMRKGTSAKRPLPGGPAYHVLVPKDVLHTRVDGYERHQWNLRVPDNSFCKVARNVYVSTPEFSFLQLAGLLSQPQLIMVGYWLCAKYRTRADGVTIPVEPVTSVAKLRSYLDDADGCYGARKARRALSWVVNDARSPTEVGTSMLAALPTRLGGYGYGNPCINFRIDATDFGPATLDRKDRKYFEIDLYWPKKRVGVEYDGAVHLLGEQIRKDKRRLNCLTAHGERILTVMYDQIIDDEIRTITMNQLGKLLGVPNRKADDDARDGLLGLLFKNEFAL